ncbi:MAG TPA: hypothetical protein VID47_17090 [Actinomycetota bacterium]
MAARRWRLTGVAVIVFMLAAVSVVALRNAAPRRAAAAKGAATHKAAVVPGDPDAPAGGQGQEEKVGDPLAGFAGWFYGQRAYPAKQVPDGAMQAAMQRASVLRANGASLRGHSNVSSSSWTNLGPMPIDGEPPAYQDPVWSNFGAGVGVSTGRVTAMAVDPSNADVVYSGGADGGVWKSTDGGDSWTSISDSLNTQSIGAIAIPPNKHKTVYVGTGEANTNSDSYYSYGLYKSSNGGASFAHIGGSTFDSLTIFRILTKGTGQLVLVATNKGLYRSNNGGSSFSLVLAPGNTDNFESFVTDVAWTYSGNAVVAAVGWRAGASTNGIYKSTNNGQTWTNLGSPPGFDTQSDIGRVSLASTPGQPKLLYAVVQSANKLNANLPGVLDGVYKSTNGPTGPWTEVESADQMLHNQTSALTDEHTGPSGPYRPGIQSWYNNYVTIDPTDPNDVIVGLEEVWNSTDGGASWAVIGRYWDFCPGSNPAPVQAWCNQGATGLYPTTHPDQHAAAFGVSGGKPVLYVGNDGGVWVQEGPGFSNDNWTDQNHNQSTTQCYTAAASADGTIICGLQDNGFVKYTGTAEWPEIAGGDGSDGVIDPSNSQNLIGSYPGMNIYRSNNGGATYTTISPGDPFPRFVSPIAMDPKDTNHIIAVGNHVWQTKKGFNTVTSDWKSMYALPFPEQGTAVSVYGKTIYDGWCGGCNPTGFNTSNGFASGIVSNIGGFHTLAASGLPNRYITAIVQDPADKMHIYVTESGFSRNWIPSAGFGHVFESTDGGATFTDISSNLPDAPVSSALLDGSNLIVGTDTGIFEQTGTGTWAPLGTGMPTVAINDLTMVPGSQTLVAATHGRGVWTLDLGSAS